jgi:plasmid stabilization system protein ParE
MPRVGISPRARQDLQRLYAFLEVKSETVASRAIDIIEAAFIPLTRMPKIGRPVGTTLRELIIDFGHSGYLALYHFNEAQNEIIILAIRHQLEDDYK